MSERLRSESSKPPPASLTTSLTNRRSRRLRRQYDDTGMTLIEVIVAVSLFLVLITSSMSILLLSLRTTEINRNRVAASNVAGRELEIVRGQFYGATRGPTTVKANLAVNENPLTGVAGSPVVLDNVRYTVTRTATWFQVGSTAVTACDDAGTLVELSYLLVHVEVRWDRMGDAKPISMDTILTPPKGTYSDGTGHIGVKIFDADGKGVAGRLVKVTSSGGSIFFGTSSTGGCTVFPFLNPDTYTISVNDSPYVGRAGTQLVTLNATVQPGQMWHGKIDYDRSATITARFTPPAGYNLPVLNDLSLSLANNGILPSGSMTKTSPGPQNPRLIPSLWPFSSGYQLWAGRCLDADPQYTADPLKPLNVRAAPVSVQSGVTSPPADVDLARVNVTHAWAGATLTASHFSFLADGITPDPSGKDNACPSGETIHLGTATAAGTLDTLLPYGKWTISAGGGRDLTVTLVRGDPPMPAYLN